MRYDIRYLRKHRGWPDLPKPMWQKIKRFLDEKTDGFRVEYDYKAVEVKPDVEFGSGLNIYLYEFGDLPLPYGGYPELTPLNVPSKNFSESAGCWSNGFPAA